MVLLYFLMPVGYDPTRPPESGEGTDLRSAVRSGGRCKRSPYRGKNGMSQLGAGESRAVPGCVGLAWVFQDRLLEDPPSAAASAAERRRYQRLAAAAGAVCRCCPLRPGCLYEAVVCHDVAGYVAGTTQDQRVEIRRRLDIRVRPENLDSIAGVAAPYRPIDQDELLRLRRAYPADTLESIARRLGCSLSTVKRHLRQARPVTGPLDDRPADGPHASHNVSRNVGRNVSRNADREDATGPGTTKAAPTLPQVMAVADQVTTTSGSLGRVA